MAPCGTEKGTPVVNDRRYDPTVALILAIFLGYLGVDRFYTGNTVAGLSSCSRSEGSAYGG